MKALKGFGLPGLLLAVMLVLASCGGAAAGSGGGKEDGGMQGMDHGSMGGDKNKGGMGGMDHGSMGSMGSEKMARQMVSPNGEHSDKAFIDAMVPHHEGAVDMAEVDLKNAQHKEIKRLARDIVGAQKREIAQMRSWCQQWYPEG